MASSRERRAKEVVENIRATKFGIGCSQKNPLALDMHQAISHLAAELYQKDLHFVMELVQNADDNNYPMGVVPELRFVLVEADVANVGTMWTLLVLNNEEGFSQANVESLCSIGLSTKKGKRDSGYIGEKGIGFKSVFLITQHPIVISNGYRIRFSDAPTAETDLGYIVPEWAAQPTDEDLHDCLGENHLPSTIIVLPIRADKVQAMREQLFQLSPQLVLFLNKIEKLSVHQMAFSQSSKISQPAKSMCVQRHKSPPPPSCLPLLPNTCSYSTVRLSSPNRETEYHVWQQEFPVCDDHEVEHRRHVKSLIITLAFPLHQQMQSQAEPDLYAFLPTKVTAGFPFIINADFLLVSSRENIRFGSKWNGGILSCIPEAFMAAFMFLLRAACQPSSSGTSIQTLYSLVPCKKASTQELESIRQSILEQIKKHDTILCATNLGQNLPDKSYMGSFFCPPHSARLIETEFREILEVAERANIQLPSLQSEMTYIVDTELAKRYSFLLSTLNVASYEEQDYIKIVRSPAWLMNLTETMYVKALYFLCHYIKMADTLKHVPLIKYQDEKGNIQLLAPVSKDAIPLYISEIRKDELIVLKWRPIFQPWVRVHFLPSKTVQAINESATYKEKYMYTWLKKNVNVDNLSVMSYGASLVKKCTERPFEVGLSVNAMHFFLHANMEGYLTLEDSSIHDKLAQLPVIDAFGRVRQNFKGPVLLPGSVCLWPRILQQNTWENHVLFLSENYLKLPSLMSANVQTEEVVQFLRRAVGASDIFDVSNPPDVPIAIHAPWELSAEDTELLLSWLQKLSYIPSKLKASLKENSWVRTADHGDKLPSQSFLDMGQWRGVFKRKDVPFVDTEFYGDLRSFTQILRNLGMVTTKENGVSSVAEHITELASQGVCEVQSDTAERWYRYLRMHNWMGWSTKSSQKLIWVPGLVPQRALGSALGSWKCADECVINDAGGHFHETLVVLSKFYTDEFLLKFFEQNMRVAANPGTEKYCQMWGDWSETHSFQLHEEICENAWSVIAKGWESCSTASSRNFKRRCRVPCTTFYNSKPGTVQLARPEEVLYADNLLLAEVFSSQEIKFAWYPRSAAASSWVEQLVNCYADLGVKKLSGALDGGGPFACTSESFHVATLNDVKTRAWKLGMYRTILGYLANPEHGLSVQARKRMLLQLKKVEFLEVEGASVSVVHYRVALAGKKIEASRAGNVRWEKGEKRIYLARHGVCNKVQLAHELAGEVARGVVGAERVVLVEGLQELLLLAAAFDFDDNAVQQLLLLRNLRLTAEDEALLDEQGRSNV